jgi:hypothetical protein
MWSLALRVICRLCVPVATAQQQRGARAAEFNLPADLDTGVPNGMAACRGFVWRPLTREGLGPAALGNHPAGPL